MTLWSLDLAAKDELVDMYGGRSLLVDKEGPELDLKLGRIASGVRIRESGESEAL